jgi:hypothetical protein
MIGGAFVHVNVSGGVNLNVVSSDGRATVLNLIPFNQDTALIVLVSTSNRGSVGSLRLLVDGKSLGFREFTRSTSVDGTDLEEIFSSGNETSSVVSEGESIRLSQRSVLSVISASNTVVPDKFILKSLFVVGCRPFNING